MPKENNEDRVKQAATELFHEIAKVARAAADEAEKFVRDKPVAGAAAAFMLGWVLSSMFRK